MVALKGGEGADKISGRNKAHHCVSGAAPASWGASSGPSSKYFSRSLMLTEHLYNSGRSNYPITFADMAARFNACGGKTPIQQHRYGSQADFQASPTLFYSDVVIMPNREALFQEYVSAR